MSLLSGASLSLRFPNYHFSISMYHFSISGLKWGGPFWDMSFCNVLIYHFRYEFYCLGFSLPDEGCIFQRVSFFGQVFLLGLWYNDSNMKCMVRVLVFLLRDMFLNESPFRAKSSCCVSRIVSTVLISVLLLARISSDP